MSGSGNLIIDASEFDGGTVLKPIGDIDLSQSSILRESIATANGRRRPKLVVDLSEVPYMDSSGVATLVEAMQVARRQGTRLILCGLQKRVQSIFEIARLNDVFVICPTVDDAVAAS